MMHKFTAALAAACVAACASASQGGFLISVTSTMQGSKTTYLLSALNTGNGTGTQLKGLEMNCTISGGKAYFLVVDDDLDGTPDTVDLANFGNVPGYGYVRLGTAGQTFFVDSSPTNQTIVPNPWTGGVSSFSVVATTLADLPADTGTGRLFAKLVVDSNSFIFATGRVGGDTGTAVPFSYYFPGGDPTPPVINPIPPVPVVFGSVVSNGAPFSVNVAVTSANATDVLTLAISSLPAGISNVNVTGGGTSPANFTVSGLVDYSLNGTSVFLPITASDGTGTVMGVIELRVTPEPASLAMLGVLGCAARRRRASVSAC